MTKICPSGPLNTPLSTPHSPTKRSARQNSTKGSNVDIKSVETLLVGIQKRQYKSERNDSVTRHVFFYFFYLFKSNLLSIGVVDPMLDIALFAGGLLPIIYHSVGSDLSYAYSISMLSGKGRH